MAIGTACLAVPSTVAPNKKRQRLIETQTARLTCNGEVANAVSTATVSQVRLQWKLHMLKMDLFLAQQSPSVCVCLDLCCFLRVDMDNLVCRQSMIAVRRLRTSLRKRNRSHSTGRRNFSWKRKQQQQKRTCTDTVVHRAARTSRHRCPQSAAGQFGWLTIHSRSSNCTFRLLILHTHLAAATRRAPQAS